MGVVRLFGTMGLYGPIVVGVARLEINLPLTLNIMYINFASKLASHIGDLHHLLLHILFLEKGGYTLHCLDP